MADDLTRFEFRGKSVRTVTIEGEPWFVAQDVCNVLELEKPRKAVSSLDEDEKDYVTITDPIGREQKTTVVSESGLYALIFKSRKPEAKEFRKWVTSEVFPQIRKTGRYALTPTGYIEALEAYLAKLKHNEALKQETMRLVEENKGLAENIKELELKLKESMEWYSIKRMEKLNPGEKFDSRLLKNNSKKMGIPVKKIFDRNYGEVDVYHRDVWEDLYFDTLDFE